MTTKEIKIRKAAEKDFPRWITMREKLWPESSFDELREAEHLYKGPNFV